MAVFVLAWASLSACVLVPVLLDPLAVSVVLFVGVVVYRVSFLGWFGGGVVAVVVGSSSCVLCGPYTLEGNARVTQMPHPKANPGSSSSRSAVVVEVE